MNAWLRLIPTLAPATGRASRRVARNRELSVRGPPAERAAESYGWARDGRGPPAAGVVEWLLDLLSAR